MNELTNTRLYTDVCSIIEQGSNDKTQIQKVSIRFWGDREVRAIWDDEQHKWWFSVLDVVGVLNDQDDNNKNRNYRKYLKTKLKKEDNEGGCVRNNLPTFLEKSPDVFIKKSRCFWKSIRRESTLNARKCILSLLKSKRVRHKQHPTTYDTPSLKLLAPDGKKRLTDVLDTDGILLLAANFPNTKASRFVAWLTKKRREY